jgi:competence protein ComEA
LKFSTALVPFAAAFVLMSGLAVAQNGAGQSGDAKTNDHPTLPDGAGRDLMIRACSKCHEPEKVVDQQFDLKGWKGIVEDMASKGMDATEQEIDQIAQYLAKAFPPK